MILEIATTHRPATDLGYLLHKNPLRAQAFDLPLRTGPRLLSRRDGRALHGGPAAGHRPRGTRASPRSVGWSTRVRQRPALRRLLVTERRARAGLRIGDGGAQLGSTRACGDGNPAGREARRGAVSRRRTPSAASLRATRLRRRRATACAGCCARPRAEPLRDGGAIRDVPAERAADASLRVDPLIVAHHPLSQRAPRGWVTKRPRRNGRWPPRWRWARSSRTSMRAAIRPRWSATSTTPRSGSASSSAPVTHSST